MSNLASHEPAALVGTITAFVAALISLLVAFGLDLTPEQRDALLGLTAVLAPIIAAIVIRSKVWSPASTQAVADQAAQSGRAPEIVRH